MQSHGRQDMGPDQFVDGLQRHRAGAGLVSQGGQAEPDALAGEAVRPPVQRLMLPVLLEEE